MDKSSERIKKRIDDIASRIQKNRDVFTENQLAQLLKNQEKLEKVYFHYYGKKG